MDVIEEGELNGRRGREMGSCIIACSEEWLEELGVKLRGLGERFFLHFFSNSSVLASKNGHNAKGSGEEGVKLTCSEEEGGWM